MKLQFQKWILSQFVSALVHFNAVGLFFGFFFTRIQYIKCFDIKQISENKTTNGGEEDKKGYMNFTESGARVDEAGPPRLGVLRTSVHKLIPEPYHLAL